MNKKGNGIYIFLSIFFGVIILLLITVLWSWSFSSSETLTDEELIEVGNYNANYGAQIKDKYISGEDLEPDYCSFKSMSDDFYKEHNCNNYDKKDNLVSICIPKGIEAKIYLDNSYIGSTNKYSNCLEFEKQYIKKIELATLWNTYSINYEEFIDFNINSIDDYTLINDWEDYKLLLDYVDVINVNNKELSIFASKLTKSCDSGDNICEINTIFNYVANSIKYRSDTRATENIKDPFETLEAGAGDCEDQAILLNSLMEQLGHKTFIVFTDTHAFSLVCLDKDLFEDFRNEVEGQFNYYDSISDNEICYYADPTVTNGYVGYKPEDYEDLVAFDSYTKEKITLD